MNKRTALAVFYLGVLVLCLGAIALASVVLNLVGYEFESLSGIGLTAGKKAMAGGGMFVLGAIIARVVAGPAGKLETQSSFRQRLRNSMRL